MNTKVLLSSEVISAFARLSHDFNPLHVSKEYARLSRFRGQISHGMLTAILLLSHLSKELGENAFPSSLLLDFMAPARPDEAYIFKNTGSKWQVLKSTDNEVCLDAQFAFESSSATSILPERHTAYEPALELMDYTLGELLGKVEECIFTPDLERVTDLNNLLTNLGLSPLSNALAGFSLFLGAISALVGMKMPGKKATILDFSWEGKENPGLKPIKLTLKTDVLLEGSQRAVIKIKGVGDGRLVGEGSVTVMVQPIQSKAFSCAELKPLNTPLLFKNKTAWVVGASRGIGNVVAKLLALGGANVVLQYYQGVEETEESVRDILSHEGKAIAVQGDIRNSKRMKQIAEEIQNSFGGTDIFISTAVENVMSQDALSLSSVNMLNELNTTVLGLHESLRTVIPQMQRRGAGKIILLSTIYTETPEKGQLKYITAKSALTGYVRALASELASDNIQVNMVVPAMTETSLLSSVPNALLDRLRNESLEGRLLSPVEVSKTILFFASNLSDAVSGQRLVVSRGSAPFL